MSQRKLLEELAGRNPLYIYGWNLDGFLAAVTSLAYAGPGRAQAVDTPLPGDDLLQHYAVISREHGSIIALATGWNGTVADKLATMILAPLGLADTRWLTTKPRRPNVVLLNPSPHGDPNGYWPSTTLYIQTLLQTPHPLLAAASITAMLGTAALAHRLYQNTMTMAGLDPNKDYPLARECHMQAYGITTMGDPAVHGEAPTSITEADQTDPCKAILRDHLLTSLRAQAEVALAEAKIEETGQQGPYKTYHATAWGRHEYEIARRLAYKHGRIILHYQDETSNHQATCIWTTHRGDPPLPTKLPQLHTKNTPAWGHYQPPINTICTQTKINPNTLTTETGDPQK